jgi:hypothetical protein
MIPTEAGDVGFVGLTCPDPNIQPLAPPLEPDLAGLILRHADELRASGAAWVVALVHDGVDWRWGPRGYDADPARCAALCRPWAGAVDAIVGTHTLGRWFGSIEGTPVVQPWPFGAELAVVELSRDGEPKTYAIAPEAGGRWTGAGQGILEKAEASVLGDLAEPLYARSGGPSPLADFFARALREAAGADAAAVDLVGKQPPADGVLCMLPAGRVSEGDLLHLYPWREDSTVVGDLGKEELRVLACTEWPEPWTAWGYGRGGPRGRGLVGAGRTGRGRSRSRGARSGPPRTLATDGDRATRRRPGSAALARCRYKPPKIGQPPTGRVLFSQPGRGWCRGRDRKARRRRRPVLWKHKRHNRRSRVHHLPCGQ